MDQGLLRQVIIALICNLLVIDSGLQEGWSTPTIPKFENEDKSMNSVTPDQVSWIINLLYVGVGIGSLVPLFLMDRIGRKWTLLIAAIPKVFSWLLIGLAKSYQLLYLGRLLAGIGCGITYSVTPMYLGEITSKDTRGPLSTSMAVLINIGVLLIYVIGLYVSRLTMAIIAIFIPTIFILTLIWLPESSVYLTRKNRLICAEKNLKWSLGKDDVEQELEVIKKFVANEDKVNDLSLVDTLKLSVTNAESRRAFGIGLILISTLTMTGAAPILAYQASIFHESGFNISTNMSIIVTGCAIVVSGMICVVLVKTTGKRPLLLLCSPICSFALAVVATFFTLSNLKYDVSNYRWVPTVFVILYVVCYGLALNPIPLAYIGEIFPFEVKAPAAIFSSLYYAVACTSAVSLYQVLQTNYGTHVPFWIFSALTLVLWILVYRYVPETEGKTLGEIQMDLKQQRK